MTPVVVVGEGRLATTVRSTVDGTSTLPWPDDLPPGAVVVAVCPSWQPSVLAAHNTRARREAVPLLQVYAEPGSVVVGPLVRPGEPGCTVCVDRRRHNALLTRPGEHAMHMSVCTGSATAPEPVLPGPVRRIVAALVAGEVDRLREGRRPATRHGFYRVHTRTAAVERHRFLPDPECPACGALPEDSAELTAVRLTPRRTIAPGTYRVRRLDDELDRLMSLYTDDETGVVSAVTKDGPGIFASVVASLGVWHSIEPGVGRGLAYRAAASAAIAEALERYGGLRPRGRRTVVRDSYTNLPPESTVDPQTLILPSPEQFDHPGSRYRPYTPEQPMNWVWGYSFARQRPVLVPESCAYYYLPERDDPPFVYEISNGCALGGCPEEAILHGLLEVAERDAFLLTWYARLPVPRVDPASAADPTVPLMVERFEHRTGYRVRAHDITMPEGVPAYWLMAVDEADRPDHPKALCAAGAGLNAEQAFRSGLQEVAALVPRAVFEYPRQRERALRMLDDSDRVAQMDDHWVLYALPEAWPRLAFLDGVQDVGKFGEPPRHTDLTAALTGLIDRYTSAGHDVVVVDQTTPEHRAADLHCVKVLVPGTLSMTFGHRQRRTGGSRLREVPVRLGYRSAPLPDEAINPYPHPFP